MTAAQPWSRSWLQFLDLEKLSSALKLNMGEPLCSVSMLWQHSAQVRNYRNHPDLRTQGSGVHGYELLQNYDANKCIQVNAGSEAKQTAGALSYRQ